jgi:hypothetical protein
MNCPECGQLVFSALEIFIQGNKCTDCSQKAANALFEQFEALSRGFEEGRKLYEARN